MRNGRRTISVLLVAAMTAGLAACGTTEVAENVTESETPENTDYNFTVSYDGIQTGDVSSGVAVHDPSIYEEDGTYYIFGSHMSAAKSEDLLHWESIADGYNKTNPVYGQIYGVADEAFAYAGSKNSLIQTDDKKTHVWAPPDCITCTIARHPPGMHRICATGHRRRSRGLTSGRERLSIPVLTRIQLQERMCWIMWMRNMR